MYLLPPVGTVVRTYIARRGIYKTEKDNYLHTLLIMHNVIKIMNTLKMFYLNTVIIKIN